MSKGKLTEKQSRFIDEYMIDLNASAAYVRAGFSSKFANTHGFKLLQNAAIKSEIDLRKSQLAVAAKVDREFIVNEYLELIKSAKKEGLDGAGIIKDRSNWAKALAQLSKHLGLDEPEKKEIEHKGEVSGFQIKIIPPKNEE
jgi:phage terminase small subunit